MFFLLAPFCAICVIVQIKKRRKASKSQQDLVRSIYVGAKLLSV